MFSGSTAFADILQQNDPVPIPNIPSNGAYGYATADQNLSQHLGATFVATATVLVQAVGIRICKKTGTTGNLWMNAWSGSSTMTFLQQSAYINNSSIANCPAFGASSAQDVAWTEFQFSSVIGFQLGITQSYTIGSDGNSQYYWIWVDVPQSSPFFDGLADYGSGYGNAISWYSPRSTTTVSVAPFSKLISQAYIYTSGTGGFTIAPISDQGIYVNCGFTDLSGCFSNALAWAFVPPSTVFDQFNALGSDLKNKPPFGYLVSAFTALGNLNASSSAQFALVESTPIMSVIFNPFRAALIWLIGLAALVWLYKHLKDVPV